jgi:hypothetical protein
MPSTIQCNIRVVPHDKPLIQEIGSRLKSDSGFRERLLTWLESSGNGGGIVASRKQYSADGGEFVKNEYFHLNYESNNSLRIKNNSDICIFYKGNCHFATLQNDIFIYKNKRYTLDNLFIEVTGYSGKFLDLLWVRFPGADRWLLAYDMLMHITSVGPIPLPQKDIPCPF